MQFLKPESALKRANEFIEVGKKQGALDTLYEIIRSKKHRTWQKIHEPIMEKYLELCVELRESHIAKDGLHQYKNICQNVNVKSLEDVILQYLRLAEEQANKAKLNANITNATEALNDVDDLDAINSPESILLKAVSIESTQDRADRDLLAPWLKFVWESYKQCLDLLKNNNKLEQLYQQVAKRAFEFCVKYQRKTEFRKLCETIRGHMAYSQKHPSTTGTNIDLTKPETQSLHLETRLIQLNHAISMELWQEAYKAVEDIYGLMSLSKNKPKPGQMYNYYTKLSLIFWKAGNYLFHAATLQKLFVLLKEQKKNMSNDELTKISTRVLLATLSIPIPPSKTPIDESLDTDDTTIERFKRLSSLLNLQQSPTRSSLLKDLIKYNVIQYVYPEVKDLYEWLEIEFHPLKLSTRVNQCLEYLEKKNDSDCSQYINAIKDITVMRLLKQISQVYTTIEIKRFIELAPIMDKFHLEKVIVDAAKNNDLQIRINHQTKTLHFGNDLYVAQREDVPEGPNIQTMLSEQIRTQLINMSNALQKSCEIINLDDIQRKRNEICMHISNVYRQTCERQHTDLLKRKQLIEAQKELYEKLASEREAIEQNTREQQERKRRDEEEHKRRLQIEERRKNADLNMIRDLSHKVGIEIPGLDDKDEEEQRLKQIEQMKKEKREMEERLKKEEKKVDHFIRACHEVELPTLIKLSEEDAKIRREYWDLKEVERVQILQKERQIQGENRDRLLRMLKDKEGFMQLINRGRNDEYQKKMNEFEEKLTLARELKLKERKEQRKLERKQKYMKEIEDRKKREEDEKKAREEEERNRKLDEIAAKQRLRLREIEEKQSQLETNVVSEREQRSQAQYQQKKPIRTTAADEDTWRRPQQPVDEPPAPQPSGKYIPPGARNNQGAAGGHGSYNQRSERDDKPFDDRRGFKGSDRGYKQQPRQDSSKQDHLTWRREESPQHRSPDREDRYRRRDDDDRTHGPGSKDDQRKSGGGGGGGGRSYKEERAMRGPQREPERDKKAANPDSNDGWTTVRGKK